MNKDMLFELLFLSDLYCFQGKSFGGCQFENAKLADQSHRSKAFPFVYIVNTSEFIKLFIH